jgi:hypothetical protein
VEINQGRGREKKKNEKVKRKGKERKGKRYRSKKRKGKIKRNGVIEISSSYLCDTVRRSCFAKRFSETDSASLANSLHQRKGM